MMFAQRKDFNVLHDDQFVVILMKDGTIDEISHILFITLGEE